MIKHNSVLRKKKHVMVNNGGPRMLEEEKIDRKLETLCGLLQKRFYENRK